MKALWKGLSSYAIVGMANTLVHWQIFYVLSTAAELSQAASNFSAYCVAACFSFYVHLIYTLETRVSVFAYVLFAGFMGAISYGVGRIADLWRIHGLMTVTAFSLLCLVCGFFFSAFVLNRGREA